MLDTDRADIYWIYVYMKMYSGNIKMTQFLLRMLESSFEDWQKVSRHIYIQLALIL